MRQTPLLPGFNPDLLPFVPLDAAKVVEVGCAGGQLAREYRKTNPECEYVGIEIDPDYASVARTSCTRVVLGNIESIDDHVFGSLFPSSCWIFGDVLEHLYDPWSVLSRVRRSLEPGAIIVACVPNAQHWSVQAKLASGEFWYSDLGLMDRTHIRWFTRKTALQMLEGAGFRVVGGRPRVVEEPGMEATLAAIRQVAQTIGTDAEVAVNDAMAYQWVLQAVAV
jgi:SAM-dependent methyltransferase